jgi:hypothetical protein
MGDARLEVVEEAPGRGRQLMCVAFDELIARESGVSGDGAWYAALARAFTSFQSSSGRPRRPRASIRGAVGDHEHGIDETARFEVT